MKKTLPHYRASRASRFPFFLIAASLFIITAFPVASSAWTQEIINAAYAVANGNATPKQRAISFQNNKVINQMALSGKIPDRVYQANQSAFKVLNDKFVYDAADENGLTAKLQESKPGELPKPGTDTDVLVERGKSPKPITAEQISNTNESYNQKVEGYLNENDVPTSGKNNWARRTDTDFMPVPSQTTPEEFAKIAAETNKNGGTMYTDPRAAEVEAKMRNGGKIGIEESNNYVKEMQKQANEKLAQADELDRQVRQARQTSSPDADALEAEAQLKRSQAGKYTERIDKVGARLSEQNGVTAVKPQGPAADSITAVSNERGTGTAGDAANVGALGEHSLAKSTRSYAENLANIVKSKPELAGEAQRAIANSASDLSASQKFELIEYLKNTHGEDFANGVAKAMRESPGKPAPSPSKTAGFFDNHPIEKNIKPLFSGDPGKVSEFMENNGGKVTLVLTAAQTLSCLSQGKTVVQCAMELAEGAVVGSVTVLVLGPTGATILGGAAGAYQVYQAGVEATKQWADARQRDVAYANREKQTQTNLDTLDKYINDFKEKKIYGELQASSASVSEACRALEEQVKSADGNNNTISLAELVAAIKSTAASCNGAASLTAEISDLLSKSKTYEDTVIKGLDWAQAKATTCESVDDAGKIRDMYNNCTSLAARIKGYSILAGEKNTKITQAIDKGNEAIATLATAQALTVKIIGKSAEVASVKDSILPQIAITIAKKNNHYALAASMLGEIDQMRKGFPDALLAANEQKFDELRGLVAKYKTLTCDPDTMNWVKRLDDIGAPMSASAQDARRSLDEAKSAVLACQNLAPSDQTVGDIDASANWVLTAIGMNEDLSQKADACMTRLKAKKESQIAVAECPQNSSPVWNEQTKDAQCQCATDYKWDDAHTVCVVDKAAKVASAKCMPSSEAYWNEATSNVRCRCTSGLKWNQDRTACVIDKDAQVAATKCWPGSESYWDEKLDKIQCRCTKGLKWNDKRNACIIDKEGQVAVTDCSNNTNSRPYWDEKQNKPLCAWCNPGYGWKYDKGTECVADKAAQIAMADCSGTPNSRPYWDNDVNDVRCKYCYEGYHWTNSSSLECISDDTASGNNGGGNINFGQVFEQINSANQKYKDDTNRINNEWNAGRQELEKQRLKNIKDTQDAQNRERQNAERERQNRQKEMESLRSKIADWENGLKCLEEGKRKFPNAWLNCNGNYTLGSRDVAIDNLRNAIRDGKARLGNLIAGGAM